jgi:phage FluMu gp28-like protein
VVKQEIYAEFLDDNGVVFRGVRDIAFLQPEEAQRDHVYVIGCDLAKLQDYTVLAVYDRKNNHQVYQMRFNKLEWSYQREKIKALSEKYNRALVLMDSTGVGEPNYEELVRMGVPVEPYHFTNELKKQLIEKLANWIELKNIRMLQLDETIQELNQFTYDISEKTGRVFYSAPIGFHDDVVISHALAVWGLQPVPLEKKQKEESLIQKDYHEKQQAYQNEENDYTEHESI